MQFVWARNPQPANTELVFSVSLDTPCDTLLLCAVDTYTVYGDGRLLAYGPERTAAVLQAISCSPSYTSQITPALAGR